MSKREEQRIAALLKKHAGKVKPPAADKAAQFDQTLRVRPEPQSEESKQFFKDMKRREF